MRRKDYARQDRMIASKKHLDGKVEHTSEKQDKAVCLKITCLNTVLDNLLTELQQLTV